MASITWLHLSDLHFGHDADPWDQDVVLQQLLEDIRNQRKARGLQPDFVVISGDVGWRGAEADYQKAGKFLDALLTETALPKERLFFAPGNHDLDRNVITGSGKALAKALRASKEDGQDDAAYNEEQRKFANEFFGKSEDRVAALKQFGNFSSFASAYLGPRAQFAGEQWFHVWRLEGIVGGPIAILGLNSAWLARGDKDRGYLALGERQTRPATDAVGEADLCIGLLHHPFDWLAEWDRNTSEALLIQRCDFILHGHLHRSGVVNLSGPNANCVVIGAGTCYEKPTYANGYNFVRLNGETGKGKGMVYLRSYSALDGGHWTDDVTTYKDVLGVYSFPLQAKLIGILQGDKIPSVKPPAASPDDAEAQERYLKYVIDSNNCLQLQGIRSAGELVRIALEDIYITLNATVKRTVAADEAMLRELGGMAAGEAARLARSEGGPRTTVEQVKVKVQEALAQNSRLVVLGDPGCGKTTLVRYLALTYARDLAGDAGLVERRLALKERRLPILIFLRDLARYLQAKQPDVGLDGSKLLLDYLREYFAQQNVTLPDDFFHERLRRGECVVLLDGVDEVADVALRRRIAGLVEKCTRAHPKARYVVTSRIVGYAGAARLGEKYAVTTVRDFNDEDIERFVTAWNRAIEVVLASGVDGAQGTREYAESQAARRTKELLTAIRANEGVRELAINPLLLTVIALVQRYRARLPERRSELYEEAIEVLLANWDAAKGLSAPVTVAGRTLDAGDQRSLLEPIALWMMEQKKREIETEELRRQLEERFGAMVGASAARKATDDFLAQLTLRSGLLVERGQGVYAFSHLTFQEYLAARAIADRPDYIAYTLARLGDGWWRETILLEAGYLSAGGTGRVTALIQAIMDCPQEPALYHNLTLAAQALGDVGRARVAGDPGGEAERRLRRAFEQPLRPRKDTPDEAVQETIRRRAAAAEALARIEQGGGTGPAFWRLPYGEPVWVDVPAGEFWMGSESAQSYADERPIHRVHLDRFLIARTPVTNAQYRIFVEKAGRKPPQGWDGDKPPRGRESHPVVNVSWHDALAYCRWLSEMTGKAISLPSEAQWEKAARGASDRREYPWGDDWDPTKCNCSELNLGDTTPVGVFPEGASPYGCLDMAGNVWEWTRSLWGEDVSEPTYRYPYVAGDGREDLAAGDKVRRVLRGGSYIDAARLARCACRGWNDPYYWLVNFGFRVGVAAAPM